MVKQLMTAHEIEELLSRVLVGRLGTCKDDQPYVIPLCFAYHKGRIYFHCPPKGRKMENMRVNARVCFQVDEHDLIPSSTPCDFAMHYRSTLVFGKVRFLTDPKEKLKILRVMMDKYDTTKVAKPLDEVMIRRVEVGEIIIEEMTGKKNE